MKIVVYNQKGEKAGTALLPKEIFDVKINSDLIHQVAVSMRSNQRQGTAHSKNRGEVRGGGRKPWRQKGTGRARHGSIRSPLWIGGGVTFGPRKERNYKKIVPKKIKRAALISALSGKVRDNEVLVLDSFQIAKPKTKLMAEALQNLLKIVKKDSSQSVLIVIPEKDEILLKTARNIPITKIVTARNLNILDILYFKNLILLKESIKVIKDTFVS